MDAPNINALRTTQALAATLRNLAVIAAEAYANGGQRGAPIVDQHFTAGNAQRQGWAPLSQAYAKRKAGQAGALRKGMKAAGRKVSKLDPAVPFQSRTGEMVGFGAGKNLPMLVRTGALREAVTSRKHQIQRMSDTLAVIVFANLPDYAQYHHTGTGSLPQRSPVNPSEQDLAQVRAEMEKALSAATGRGGAVPVSGTSVPGRARVV